MSLSYLGLQILPNHKFTPMFFWFDRCQWLLQHRHWSPKLFSSLLCFLLHDIEVKLLPMDSLVFKDKARVKSGYGYYMVFLGCIRGCLLVFAFELCFVLIPSPIWLISLWFLVVSSFRFSFWLICLWWFNL